MTDNEMRQRLAEAMGWTDVRTQPRSGQMTGIDQRCDAFPAMKTKTSPASAGWYHHGVTTRAATACRATAKSCS